MYIKIDKKNRVTLQIADKFAEKFEVDNVTTFRTEKEFAVKPGEVLYYNANTDSFYTKKHETTEGQKAIARSKVIATRQKEVALKWLADNDWKVNKVFIGEWADTDPRWLEYLEQRNKARANIDAADAILNK